MTEFENRQAWDLDAWPEMYGKVEELMAVIFMSPPDIQTNTMVFTIASLTAGCRHCQAHGAYGLDKAGVDLAKIQGLWSFETSDLFSDRERSALRFGVAAVTDAASVDWAAENLVGVGWDIGKHVGEVHEQRSGPPGG